MAPVDKVTLVLGTTQLSPSHCKPCHYTEVRAQFQDASVLSRSITPVPTGYEARVGSREVMEKRSVSPYKSSST